MTGSETELIETVLEGAQSASATYLLINLLAFCILWFSYAQPKFGRWKQNTEIDAENYMERDHA